MQTDWLKYNQQIAKASKVEHLLILASLQASIVIRPRPLTNTENTSKSVQQKRSSKLVQQLQASVLLRGNRNVWSLSSYIAIPIVEATFKQQFVT